MEPYRFCHDRFSVTAPCTGLCPCCHASTGWNISTLQDFKDYRIAFPIANYCQVCKRYFYDICELKIDNTHSRKYEFTRIWPTSTPADIPPPNPDMPAECHKLYNGAALVFNHSPRTAGALLRLCLQVLLTEAKIEGKTIDLQIQNLIKSGEDPMNVLCMDICRILGNECVHPGIINLNEEGDIATLFFEFINMTTTRLFTAKRQVQEVYQKLPEGARKALEARNAKIMADRQA